MTQRLRNTVFVLQEFSIPLIAGVFFALIAANLYPHQYQHMMHWMPVAGLAFFGHDVTLHFLVNDIFMVLFFGLAAKEITEACLPGGDLNPFRKAINPLVATLGGVVGPVAVFFAGLWAFFALGIYDPATAGPVSRGWGIPTATDIALAWLVARTVFGSGHPAINFLLLLAVADDAIGLGIIAVFYGDPQFPAQPMWLLLVAGAMGIAFAMRKFRVNSWIPYIVVAGPIAWAGLMLAHLHPALALVPIVPFIPGPKHDDGMFLDHDPDEGTEVEQADHHAPLHMFEHQMKIYVDFGLFLFAFANAGVALAGIGPMTWLVLGALVVGKTVGIGLCGLLAVKIGFPLPKNMGYGDLVLAGFIGALGLTVALFVASAAFVDPVLQGEAKMGALFSGAVGIVAVGIARMRSAAKSSGKRSAEANLVH